MRARERTKRRESRNWSAVRLAAAAAALAAAAVLAGCSSSSQGTADSGAANESSSAASMNSAADASGGAGTSADRGSGKASGAEAGGGMKDAPAAGSESSSPPSGGEPEQGRQNPQAGRLTAGEWNDLAHWQDWQQRLAGSEGRANLDYWSFGRFDRLDVLVTAGGKPVSDARVSIVSKDGQTVWDARTDMTGHAAAFAGLFGSQQSQDSYLVEARTDSGEVKRFDHVPVPRGKTLEIKLDQAAEAPSNHVDLMLVVDATGSMGDELHYLQTELSDVVERVSKDSGQRLAIRISPNFYRDRGDEYVVRPFPFTRDVSEAVANMAAQQANGGDDYPEAVDEALDNAIHEHEWSGEARARLLFLVLDAPPHHNDNAVKRMQELTRDAAKAGIRIVPVASSGVDANTEYLMRFMAAATGGTYVFLTDHSGIGGEHKDAEVGEYEVKSINDLLVAVINRYCGGSAGSAKSSG